MTTINSHTASLSSLWNYFTSIMQENGNSNDGLRIPPNIFVGFLALFLSFLAYICSSTSLGKRSISHTWLFSGLLVINPSEESLNKIAPTTTQSSVTPKRRNPSPIKDVSALELTCKSILPGAIPLSVMTEKKRAFFRQWQALDAAVCVWLACLVALLGPHLLAWYTVYQEQTVCCDDLKCWLNWWRDQLGGAGLIYNNNTPPTHSMLVFLVGLAIWFWWRLVIHVTRNSIGGYFMYSPFSYINGWFTFFVTLFLLQLTSDPTTGQNQSLLGIPLNAALEEWSTRVTLWVGLTGFYSPSVDTSQQRVLENMIHLTQLLFAVMTSLLGFAISDPLRETMHLYWGNIWGDEVHIIDRSNGKLMRWVRRKQRESTMLAIAILPVLCISTYIIQLESFQHFSPRAIRTILAWCFIWNLGMVIRPLQQKYLLQALSAADHILDSTKKPTPGEIHFPFKNRGQRVLSTGSQLLVFPAIILIVLTLGHSAGLPPVALSQTESIKTGIYPFAFYHSLWTDREEKDYQAWEEFQAKASAQTAMNDETIIAELTATRANIDLCQENVSFAFLSLPDNDDDEAGNIAAHPALLQEYSAPIFRIDSASQLIPSKILIKTTFVQVLRKLQRLARKARLGGASNLDSSINKESQELSQLEEEQLKSQQDFHSLLQALAFHPLLTSTVVLPVLDFTGLMLSYLWIMYFAWYGIRAWPGRRKRRRYVLQVKGENCRVVAIEKVKKRQES